MANVSKRTISLPVDQAAYIDAKVAAGDYVSASEVVRAGLRALQDRDAAIEKWLRTEVVEAYDELLEHPERAIPVEDVFSSLRAHIARRRVA